jgi:predicted glycosyl hydrolase (DUF1957 family)
MIHLGFLLHIYQPPNQIIRVLDKIVYECYSPLLDLINSRKHSKFTLNLNYSLTELLMKNGHTDIIDKMKQGLKDKKLEITGTAAYHAILPLIPKDEQERQINLNYEKNKAVLGDNYKPKGFFPPEMAFGHEIVDSIRDAGYKWAITDDQPFNCIHNEVPWNYIPEMDGLPVFLRSNLWSNKISMEKHGDGRKFSGWEVCEWLMNDMNSWWQGKDGYVIIAMDGETYGHHVPGYIEYFLGQFMDALDHYQDQIKMTHITKLLKVFPRVKNEVPPGSWSTNAQDFWSGNFFPLWKNRYNASHQLLWELVELAIETVKRLQGNLDKSLNSCTFWWAAKNERELSPITYTGIKMLIDIIKHADPSKLERAMEIEEELHQIFTDKRHLGMLANDEVLVESDW